VKLAAETAERLVQADAVLLHSPSAGRVLAGLLRAHPAPNLRVLGLSKAVIKPLARIPVAAKAFPSMPLEAALLNLIERNP
jgi:uroporphyrinogen-III synthase